MEGVIGLALMRVLTVIIFTVHRERGAETCGVSQGLSLRIPIATHIRGLRLRGRLQKEIEHEREQQHEDSLALRGDKGMVTELATVQGK